MTPTLDAAPTAHFEGFATGTDAWGYTQANFLVRLPGRAAREAAVLLNHPAAVLIAAATGREESEEFRFEAVRAAGEAVLAEVIAGDENFQSILTVSKGYLDEHPSVLEHIRKVLG